MSSCCGLTSLTFTVCFFCWVALCNFLCPAMCLSCFITNLGAGSYTVRSKFMHSLWWHSNLWPLTCSRNECLAWKTEIKHSRSCLTVSCVGFPCTWRYERCFTSADPQSETGRKSHLALWCSTGWLTAPLPEPDESETSHLSSFSASRLSAPFSELTFPQHDEPPCDIYVLLRFPCSWHAVRCT